MQMKGFETVFKKGRWSIFSLETWPGLRIWSQYIGEFGLWHRCYEPTEDQPSRLSGHVAFSSHSWGKRPFKTPSWRCQNCLKKVPKTILSVYLLLNHEHIPRTMKEGWEQHNRRRLEWVVAKQLNLKLKTGQWSIMEIHCGISMTVNQLERLYMGQ